MEAAIPRVGNRGEFVRFTTGIRLSSTNFRGELLQPIGRENIDLTFYFGSAEQFSYSIEIPQTSVRKERGENAFGPITRYLFDSSIEIEVSDGNYPILVFTRGTLFFIPATPGTRAQFIRDLERIKSMIETEVATRRSATARRAGRRKALKATRRRIRK